MEISISDELNSIINFSREEAMRTGSYGIAPDHFFLGMIRHRENTAIDALRGVVVDIDEMKQFIDSKIFTNEHIPYSEINNVSFSRGAQNVLSFTILEATRLKSFHASSQHLLLALCKSGNSYGSTYLRDLGVDYERVYKYLDRNEMLDIADPNQEQKDEEQGENTTHIRIRAVRQEEEQKDEVLGFVKKGAALRVRGMLDIDKFDNFAKNIFDFNLANKYENALAGIECFEKYLEMLDMPKNYVDLNIESVDIESLADILTNGGARIVGHHVKPMDRDVAIEIFNSCI